MATSPASPSERYEVLVQGKVHPWSRDTITVAEIRELGGFPAGSTVMEEDFISGTERALAEGYVHEITPLQAGKTVEKKVGFKQG